ncbi:DUF397 domain-containing protein [Streptomyces actinomycinicus]|uniref:DUF397 domain-containing protein n=1 Tax=Streptomyces actinomycinicus TaxID=1695166 RepID=A0A937EE23_9ACTN|nr:DUF397 domain-containing protein [Streptomyces actinomycinicus]MBL1080828.1 DUF397 domain-containing protein [Streptomyces actinomycinicus]
MRRYDLTNARWRKSTYSGGSGGESCVEVGYDFPGAAWRKSTYSGGSGGEDCLEVADGVPGVVPVRDSKVADGAVLVIGAAAWTEFVRAVGR